MDEKDTIMHIIKENLDLNYSNKEFPIRIAIPVSNGLLNPHFGHSDEFYIYTIDDPDCYAIYKNILQAPPHQPGLLPGWLKQQQVNIVITGGIGTRAKVLFEQQSVKVITGAQGQEPDYIIQQFLKGQLKTGNNACDH